MKVTDFVSLPFVYIMRIIDNWWTKHVSEWKEIFWRIQLGAGEKMLTLNFKNTQKFSPIVFKNIVSNKNSLIV